MSEHDKNVHAVRTFADDLLKERGKDSTPTSAPVTDTNNTPVKLVPLEPKTPTKSAADYLRSTTTPATETEPTPTEPEVPAVPTASFRAAPVIPKTAVLGELEHVGRAEKTSILSDEGNLHGGQDDGVIIQDKKRDRFKLLPAVGKAVSGWAKEKTTEIVETKAPAHTITKAEARLKTIEAAAESSKRVPQEDFATVAAKLRAQERKPVDTKIIVKDKAAVPPPSWNNYTEDNAVAESVEQLEPVVERPEMPVLPNTQPDMLSVTQVPLEADDEPRFMTSRRKRPLPTPTPIAKTKTSTDPLSYNPRWDSEKDDSALAEAALRTETKLDVASARLAAAAETVPDELTAPSPESLTPAVPLPAAETVVPAATITSESIPSPTVPKLTPEFSNQLRAAAQQKQRPTTDNEEANGSGRLYVTIGVVFIVISIAVGGILLISNRLETSDQIIAAPENAPLVSGASVPVRYDTFHDTFMNNILKARSEGTGLRTLSVVDESGANVHLRLITEGMLPNVASVLSRNVNQFTVGYTAAGAPFILIDAENYDSLFGGLLGSEPYLSRNLAPVFGSPTPGTFVDTTILERPARVLKNGQGSEALFYVFLDDTLVLIATSRTEAVDVVSALVR